MLHKEKFKNKVQVTVRNNEIDWQGVVHNSIYLHYFEVGRMSYFEKIGFPIKLGNPQALEWRVVIGRNEIDYRSAARFDETLNVYTRISWVRQTSFALEGYIEEATSQRLIAENVSLHVWLDKLTDKPLIVPMFFRRNVRECEGKDVLIQEPTLAV